MKFTHTLALIAATMAALPTTGAVKLDQANDENIYTTMPVTETETQGLQSQMADTELAMILVDLIFDAVDTDPRDDWLSRDELEKVFNAIHEVYNAADLMDEGGADGMVHRENLKKVLRIQTCVAKCQMTGGTCCDKEEEPVDFPPMAEVDPANYDPNFSSDHLG